MAIRGYFSEPTWVYRCFTSDRRLLYVGVAVDLQRRMAQHAATKPWWPDATFVYADQYSTRRKALTVESWFITHHNPVHNVMGMPDGAVLDGALRTQLLYPGVGPGGLAIGADVLPGEVD